ncbi:terminase small subunit [Pseudomonas aeruginosa]|uniref:terminase small subunit n=1 Tax=Pseudomonas aeruginosa TaxID=287 RepID=UPI000F5242AA|nr:terminase small subunit [Pseudomonas aeruginosa]EIU7095337.1 terminase small subunit [Pseudomonas aeruginosa]EIU7115575.1 terminase small subunit [Pseudomonas aeruginosa]EKB4873326.1 terminase small subunit [Pseudomonas aeruginosa]EKE7658585.1 terminase small subunit [Pseudomonas aeruginosa]ELR9521570.1 terminase small subunit [Pseudomonas aeruginosa]
MALTAKQRRFVAEYLLDLNATQAAIRAGYSKNRASEIGYQLLQKPGITSAIQAAMKERAERTQIDADYVLRRMIEIDQMDLLDIMTDAMELKPVSQWPRVWRQYLSGFDLAEMFEGKGDSRAAVGILKKIKWPDKVKNLELLGRHHGVFTDKFEHSGPGGGPIPTMPTMIELVAPGESTD